MRFHRLLLVVFLLAGLAACSDSAGNGNDLEGDADQSDGDAEADSAGEDGDAEPTDRDDDFIPNIEIPEGCNPLAPEWDCLLPYPSNVFLQPDDELPGGMRVKISGAARVLTDAGLDVAPFERFPADGFSHLPQILCLFPEGVDVSNLPSHHTGFETSVTLDSPTLLIEADTGRLIPHFSELDALSDDIGRQAMVIRPMVRLENATRYIVAIRHIQKPDGELHPTPKGFQLIRDGETGAHPVLAPLAEKYETEIFPVLEDAGVERSELQLAWDFNTQTIDNVAGDMFHVREDLIEKLSADPPAVQITEDVPAEDENNVWRRLEGLITVPLYMENPEPLAKLNRDEAGQVVPNGTTDVPFSVMLPECLSTWQPGDDKVRVIQYGHGFFGGRDENTRDWLTAFANRYCFIFFTNDMWGMTRADSPGVGGMIVGDPPELVRFTDRVHQGMANHIAMSYAIRESLINDDAFKVEDETFYDPEELYYYGNSQGGILGGTYTALSPLIRHYVIGVGGGSFTMIMFRSRNFMPFMDMMYFVKNDAMDIQKWTALVANAFDRIDPVTYAPFTLKDPLAGLPEKRVLMQVGIGDTDVPNMTSHVLGRTLGVDLLDPAPREVPGLETVEAPGDYSVMVEFDLGIDPLPGELAMPSEEGNIVHNAVRQLDAANEQINQFLQRNGDIQNFCDGPCDPE